MRRAVPLLLGGSLIGLVALTIARSKPGHEAPLVVIQDEGKADAAADAAPSSDASGPVADASVVAVASDAGDAALPTAAPRVLDRPLRVTTLGSVLAAPATVFKEATDGARDAGGESRPSLELELTTVTTPQKLEARLIHGGADADGADVVILSLPDLVASSERLRALEPQAFLVVGFSQGTERIVPIAGTPRVPPAGADVTLVLPPGDRRASRAFVALFGLEAFGVAHGKVRVVETDEKSKSPAYLANTFFERAEGEALLSTVEAPGLVPYVAVATRGFLSTKEPAARAFADGWLLALQRVYADAGLAARRVVGKEGVVFSAASEGGADLPTVVDHLGRLSKVSLGDEARYFGLPAKEGRRGPLSALASNVVEVFGDAGLVASPPTWDIVEPKVVAELAKSTPPAQERLECARAKKAPLVVRREAEKGFDEATFQKKLEALSLAFEGCALRVSLRGGEKPSQAFVEATRAKLGLSEAKLVFGKAPVQGAAALVEAVPPSP